MSRYYYTSGKNKIEFLIDQDDLEFVEKNKWYLLKSSTSRTNYLFCRKRIGKIVKIQFLHRFLTNCPKGKDVDHINGDGLDNRKSNLRICTRSQNKMNTNKITKKCTSIFKGVSFAATEKRKRKWRASITINGKSKTIGRFLTENEAALAYNKQAIVHFGKYANINKIQL
jgi:hypothetical protein